MPSHSCRSGVFGSRLALRGITATAIMFGIALPLAAQTSSWQQRIDAPDLPAAPKSTPKGVKSQQVAPTPPKAVVLPGLPVPQPKAGSTQTLGPSTVPTESLQTKSPGGDPAYEAYDQGKYLTALQLAEKQAAAGEPQAHTLIARIHGEGLGVPRSYGKAVEWYTKGAALGDIESSFGLGMLYVQGAGVAKSYDEAAKHFEKAAMKGHPLANYNLALLFLKGQGKSENPQRAFKHIEYAAEKGVVSAQYDLGTMMTTGVGVEANAFEGAKWIGRAARAGHPEAEIEYATILFKSDEQDTKKRAELEKEGARLFRSAADKGFAVAQNRLARCYAHGKGVAKDMIEAAKWYFIANAGGVEDATLEPLVAKMARADRQKAEQAAADWRDRSQVQ